MGWPVVGWDGMRWGGAVSTDLQVVNSAGDSVLVWEHGVESVFKSDEHRGAVVQSAQHAVVLDAHPAVSSLGKEGSGEG